MGLSERRDALERGARAERLVGERLRDEGWDVLERNWRGAGGEIDLIVRKDDVVRFVEVKARDPHDPTGIDAVTEHKRRKLVRAAEEWLSGQRQAPRESAFLVAIVDFLPDGWKVAYVDDAFDGA
jgi:putative endonuclease